MEYKSFPFPSDVPFFHPVANKGTEQSSLAFFAGLVQKLKAYYGSRALLRSKKKKEPDQRNSCIYYTRNYIEPSHNKSPDFSNGTCDEKRKNRKINAER